MDVYSNSFLICSSYLIVAVNTLRQRSFVTYFPFWYLGIYTLNYRNGRLSSNRTLSISHCDLLISHPSSTKTPITRYRNVSSILLLSFLIFLSQSKSCCLCKLLQLLFSIVVCPKICAVEGRDWKYNRLGLVDNIKSTNLFFLPSQSLENFN